MDPCVTPDNSSRKLLQILLMRTDSFLPFRSELISFSASLPNPSAFNFVFKRSRGLQPKALEHVFSTVTGLSRLYSCVYRLRLPLFVSWCNGRYFGFIWKNTLTNSRICDASEWLSKLICRNLYKFRWNQIANHRLIGVQIF